MSCLDCTKLDLRRFPRHAVAGIGKCEHASMTGMFVVFNKHKDCQQFVEAPAEQAEARKAWWAKQVEKDRTELAQQIEREEK